MTLIPTDPSIDALADSAVEKARTLIHDADRLRGHSEKANRRRFSRLFRDPQAIEVTITLTDEVMRIHSVKSSINIFRRAATKASIEGFGAPQRHRASSSYRPRSRLAPGPVIHAVATPDPSSFPGPDPPLRRRGVTASPRATSTRRHRHEHQRFGEAVLGEREADERLERVIEMIRRPERQLRVGEVVVDRQSDHHD